MPSQAVMIGDSITQQWTDHDPDFFASNGLINKGIGGQVSTDIAARFAADVLCHGPTFVVILAGTNDIAGNGGPYNVEATCANLVRMTDMAAEAGIKPILCSVPPAVRFPWNPVLEPQAAILDLNARIRVLATRRGIGLADYFTVMADQKGRMHEGLSSDGVHPNLAGYKIMEQVVLTALRDRDTH